LVYTERLRVAGRITGTTTIAILPLELLLPTPSSHRLHLRHDSSWLCNCDGLLFSLSSRHHGIHKTPLRSCVHKAVVRLSARV